MFENTDADSEIEKKRLEEEMKKNMGGPWESIMTFLKTTLIFVVLVLLLILTGSFYLFTAKIGQSNILPTEKNCMPYGEGESVIQPVQINANITEVDGIRQSQKVNFDYKENSKNVFLDFLKKIADFPLQSGISMYFTTMIQDMLCLNYQMTNSLYSLINSAFSESLTLFLLPILAFFAVPIIGLIFFLVNYVYFYYSWLAKLGWFFKKNTNKDMKMKPVWADMSITSEPLSYFISLILTFTVIGFLIFSFFIPIPIFGSIIAALLVYVGLTPLFMTGKKNNTEDYTFFSSLIDNFKYYRGTIMGTMTFFIILTTFSSLGWIAGLFSILTFLLFYFQFIPIPIYSSPVPNDLSPLALFEQAKKECKFVDLEESNPGLLSKISKFLHLSGGGSGKDLDKSIKTLNKLLR